MKSNEEVRLTIKKIMVSRGFLNTKEKSGETWSKEDSNAWTIFSNSVEGLRYFSTKIPSLETLSKEALEKIEIMGKDLEAITKAEEPMEEELNNYNREASEAKESQEPEIKENGVDGIIPEEKVVENEEIPTKSEEAPVKESTTKRGRKKKEA